ncbi:uncharacterized protein LOC134276729 isoform X3 [Saccostrea cucullata]|uniref:uncharacterized protein LOC134276729 isoform X3 n=1 Tax=Saccostrea cuccullata TaxID=36930 RepID=UPI002ED16BD2
MASSTSTVPPNRGAPPTGTTPTVSPEETNFLRFVNLVLKRAPKALRVHFDTVHPPSNLVSDLVTQKTTLSNLKSRKIINQVQWDTLFGVNNPSSKDFDVTLLICLLRNMSPCTLAPPGGFDCLPNQQDVSVGADLARIKFYRNTVAHSADARMATNEFNSSWTDVEGAIGRLGGSTLLYETKTLRFSPMDESERELILELLLEINQLRLENLETVPWNVRESIEEKLMAWEEEDHLFVETKASTSIEKFVMENSCVVVVGHPGSGKSAIIHHIALKMGKQGFSVIPIKSPDKILDYYNKRHAQVFVIDDPCGEFSVNDQAFEWIKYSEDIKRCLNFKQRKEQVQSKLLVSCRLALTSDHKFRKIKVFSNFIFSLENQKNHLSITEKKKILEAHFQCELDFPPKLFEKHIDCFPLLCRLYVHVWADPKCLESFFENPFIHLVSKLNLMIEDPKRESIYEYCALVCCSLSEDKLALYLSNKDKNPSDNFECLEQIHNACEIDLNPSELLSAVNRQSGKYIKQVGQTFSVIHTKLLDIIIWHFGKQSPKTLIKFSPLEIFQNRLRPFGKLKCDDNKDLFLVELDESMLTCYVERIQKDIERGIVVEVFQNPALPNAKVESCIFSLLEERHVLAETLTKTGQSLSAGRMDSMTSFSKEELFRNSQISFLHLLIAYNWSTFLEYLFQMENETLFQTLFDQKACSIYSAILSGNIEIVKWCFDYYFKIYESVQYLMEEMFSDDNCLYCDFDKKKKSHEDYCQIARIPLSILVCITGKIEILEFLIQKKVCSQADLTSNFHLMEEMVSPLMVSSLYGHCDLTHFLLLNGATVNFQNELGISALHDACRNNHISVIKLLHDFGAEVNIKDDNGETPFSLACRNGSLEAADLLITLRANVNLQDNLGWTALHSSIFFEQKRMIPFLIEKGCDINLTDNDGETSLSLACFLGNCDTIKYLLEKGINRQYQQTGLLKACQSGKVNTASFLLEQGLDINYRDENGLAALHVSCAHNNSELLHYLLSKGACPNILTNDNRTPLHIASENLFEECISILVKHGVNINALDMENKTALHYACRNPNTERFFTHETRKNDRCFHGKLNELTDVQQNSGSNVISNNTPDMTKYILDYCQYENSLIEKLERIVNILIQSNIDINIPDKDGITPLHTACLGIFSNVIEMLLRNEAQVNLLDKDGRTPLHVVCLNGNSKVLMLLIQNGGNVNIADKTGSTPLHIAAQHHNIDILSSLISNGANVNFQDHNGLTPLHVSCYNDDIDIVQKLLESDVDASILSKDGLDPLTVSVANGYFHISEEILKKGVHIHDMNFSYLLQCVKCKSIICQVLEEYNEFFTYRNSEGQTLLHLATLGKMILWIECLQGKDDLINVSDNEGHIPFFYAIENDLQDIIKLFLKEDLSEAMEIEYLRMAHKLGRGDIVSILFEKYPSLLSNLNGSDYRIVPKLLRTQRVSNKIMENALKSRKYLDIYSIILVDLPCELWNVHTSTVPCLSPENCMTSDRNWLEEKKIIDEVRSIRNVTDLYPLDIWPLLFYSDYSPMFESVSCSEFVRFATLKDEIGNTFLHYMCLMKNDLSRIKHYLFLLKNKYSFYDFFSQNTVDIRELINMQNLAGCTPLHYAVRNPHAFRLLADLGAEIGIKDKSGHYAEHYMECRTTSFLKNITSVLSIKN